MRATERLRELLASPGILVGPGVHDGLSARLAEQAGFESIFITGLGLEAVRLGSPDLGLMSMTDVVSTAEGIANCVRVPSVCDADTGYGGVLNVYRTVRAFERAGVAGIHLEDQRLPKRCGGLPGKVLVSSDDMVATIRAALDARLDKDFVIIARSDAKSQGLAEVIRRLNIYLEAGADVAMVAEPGNYTVDELRELCRRVDGPMCCVAGQAGAEETLLSVAEFERLGVKVLMYPITALVVAARAMAEMYATLRSERWIRGEYLSREGMTLSQINDIVGLNEWVEREERYVGERAEV
jgi:2,3-dimethylmalate lyase